jgi:uncharacterized protein
LAQQRGIAHVATGTNADDLAAPHRPGLAAAAERGVVTPLADAGLTKADIREASRRWGLTTWDKPQAACLASRVAYGVHVQPQRLARIDRAEAAVRAELARVGVTVSNVRVRDLGDRASIEIDPEWVAAASDRCDLGALVRAVGFTSAAVDRHGFRTGALNERLSPTERLPGHLNRSSWDLPVVD